VLGCKKLTHSNVLYILLAHTVVQLDGDAYVTVLDTAIVRCIVRVDHNC